MHDNTVRVAEVELGCAGGRTAEVFSAHSDARLEGAGLARGRNTVLGEDLHDPFVVEVVDGEAKVGDACIVARTAAERDELRTVTDLEHDGAGLACYDGHAEQSLIPR